MGEAHGRGVRRAVRERLCPEASGSDFVRERSWVRARRLGDDEGEGRTYEMYLELVKKSMGYVESGKGAREARRPRRTKRCEVGVPVVIEISDSGGDSSSDVPVRMRIEYISNELEQWSSTVAHW